MTIDEAIKHCEEVAEEHTRYNRYGGFESWNDVNCAECAKEHRQLANWLKELKHLREQDPCEDAISRQALLNMYECLDEESRVYAEQVVKDVKALPSVTPTTKKCHNENRDYDSCDQFVCSNCGIELQDWHAVERSEDGDITYHEYEFKYCPNCGARIGV